LFHDSKDDLKEDLFDDAVVVIVATSASIDAAATTIRTAESF